MSARTPDDVHPLFARHFAAADMPALLSLYEPDAVLLPQPGVVARGHAAIRDSLNAFLAMKGTFRIASSKIVQMVREAERHKAPFLRLADMLGGRRPDIPILVVQSGRDAGLLNSVPGIDFKRYPQIMAAPPTPQPADYLALTRVLLAPSVWAEPFGRVAAEALVNGIPPVVSDRGGLPEAVGGDFAAGGAGFVRPLPECVDGQPPRLPSEEEMRPWFDTVCSLWDDTALYRLAGERGRALAAARYSEAVSRSAHLDWLQSLTPTCSLWSAR